MSCSSDKSPDSSSEMGLSGVSPCDGASPDSADGWTTSCSSDGSGAGSNVSPAGVFAGGSTGGEFLVTDGFVSSQFSFDGTTSDDSVEFITGGTGWPINLLPG